MFASKNRNYCNYWNSLHVRSMFLLCLERSSKLLFMIFLPVLQIFIRKGISIINSAAVIPPPPTQELGVRSVSLYLHSETVAMDCPSWLPWTVMHDFHGMSCMITNNWHAWLSWITMHDYHGLSCMIVIDWHAWLSWTALREMIAIDFPHDCHRNDCPSCLPWAAMNAYHWQSWMIPCALVHS